MRYPNLKIRFSERFELEASFYEAFILHGSLNSTAISIGSCEDGELRQKYPATQYASNVLWTSAVGTGTIDRIDGTRQCHDPQYTEAQSLPAERQGAKRRPDSRGERR